ncbi:hypothetical protein LJPFL01_2427 [Lelliottia jeotgali]|nr:hypothetical protein LJPFL01_2427 [Lelliottia jeotgali]
MLTQKFFLCDFPFWIPHKTGVSQNFLLAKKSAQEKILNKRHPRWLGKM